MTRLALALTLALTACGTGSVLSDLAEGNADTLPPTNEELGPLVNTAANTTGYQCNSIGTSTGDGFFSLESFNGHVYAGEFGYGLEGRSMLNRLPPFQNVTPGITGVSESICALLEHDGTLYANTESSGDIFRSSDGSNWQRVYDGANGVIGCGLAELNGEVYAINYDYATAKHGKIMRENGGAWSTVFDSGSEALYLREIVAYAGQLYAFGVANGQPYTLSSSNGSTWSRTDAPARFFRGHVWKDILWLTSTNRTTNVGTAGVWRFDGSSFDRVHDIPQPYGTDIISMDGKLFAATSGGWKDDVGPSALWMSPDGISGWQIVCQFNQTAAWDMTVLNGKLYVGTWQYRSRGFVFEVSSAPLPTGECAPRSGSLAVGATHVVAVDRFTGDEHTAEPKTDANNGQNGDNPRYRRHNVARAHGDYWYSSAYQDAGEPSPSGPQWVDYTPDFDQLGVGCYQIIARYRATENRATYAAQYRIRDSWAGDILIERVQRRGNAEYVNEDLGQHSMCPNSTVRIEDPGTSSITFNELKFVYLGATCSGGNPGPNPGPNPGDCTAWDYSNNAPCAAGTYNCDCSGHCGGTSPCGSAPPPVDPPPGDCTSWDNSNNAPCAAGTYNCDCSGHCGGTTPCDSAPPVDPPVDPPPSDCTTWDYSNNAPCSSGTYNCDCSGHCGGTTPCGSAPPVDPPVDPPPSDCTTWDYNNNAPCPGGTYNCDCSGHCGGTSPCGTTSPPADPPPSDCTNWDNSNNAACSPGTYNCDCSGHCGGTSPC